MMIAAAAMLSLAGCSQEQAVPDDPAASSSPAASSTPGGNPVVTVAVQDTAIGAAAANCGQPDLTRDGGASLAFRVSEESAGTRDDNGVLLVTSKTAQCLGDELHAPYEMSGRIDATLGDPAGDSYQWDDDHLNGSWVNTTERGLEMVITDDRVPSGS